VAAFSLFVASYQVRWSREWIFGLGTYATTMTAIRVVHDASSFLLDLWNIRNLSYYGAKFRCSQA